MGLGLSFQHGAELAGDGREGAGLLHLEQLPHLAGSISVPVDMLK